MHQQCGNTIVATWLGLQYTDFVITTRTKYSCTQEQVNRNVSLSDQYM